MGYYPQESLYKPSKYHGYTVRGTPNCPLILWLTFPLFIPFWFLKSLHAPAAAMCSSSGIPLLGMKVKQSHQVTHGLQVHTPGIECPNTAFPKQIHTVYISIIFKFLCIFIDKYVYISIYIYIINIYIYIINIYIYTLLRFSSCNLDVSASV